MLPVNPPIKHRILHTLVLSALAIGSVSLPARAQQAGAGDPCKHTITGELQAFELNSKVFLNTRTVRVFLPPGYSDAENKDRKYPVLYMFDGQNLFDVCTAFDHTHEWEIDETVTRLAKEGKIEPLIVVGLDNAHNEQAWAKRFPEAITFLFPAQKK